MLARRKRFWVGDIESNKLLPCLYSNGGRGHIEDGDAPHEHSRFWCRCGLCASVFFKSDDTQWLYPKFFDGKGSQLWISKYGRVSPQPSEFDKVVEAAGGTAIRASVAEVIASRKQDPLMCLWTRRRSTFMGTTVMLQTISDVMFWAPCMPNDVDPRLRSALEDLGYICHWHDHTMCLSVAVKKSMSPFTNGYAPAGIGFTDDGKDIWRLQWSDGKWDPIFISMKAQDSLIERNDLVKSLDCLRFEIEEYENTEIS